MPAAIELIPHLTVDELATAARSCRDANLRVRIDAIRLAQEGWPQTEIAAAFGYDRGWVRDKIKRFNEAGLAGLEDGRKGNGKEPFVDEELQEELVRALKGPAPDGGLWSGPKVKRWLEEKLGRRLHERIGWEYLRRLGFTLQRPQSRHAQADEARQDAFKKNWVRS